MLNERIAEFVRVADEKSVQDWGSRGYTFSKPPQHRADYISAKWCRVVVMEERNGVYASASVYAFIALQDYSTKALGAGRAGDIMKPATYKAPAKHARGNVFDMDFEKCLTSYGPVYLKRGA